MKSILCDPVLFTVFYVLCNTFLTRRNQARKKYPYYIIKLLLLWPGFVLYNTICQDLGKSVDKYDTDIKWHIYESQIAGFWDVWNIYFLFLFCIS